MSTEVRASKTDAESALEAHFAAARHSLPGAPAVASLREDAFRRFAADGLPHRRIEEWKYTDLRAFVREAKPLAPPPDAAAKRRASEAGAMQLEIDARRIVFVDGSFVPELSDLAAPEPGLTICSMASLLASGEVGRIGRMVATDDIAVALNTAFMGDGVMIDVAPGVALTRPIHLIFVNTGEHGGAVFMRSLITIGDGARA